MFNTGEYRRKEVLMVAILLAVTPYELWIQVATGTYFRIKSTKEVVGQISTIQS